MLYRPFVDNIYMNLPFLGLVASLGALVFAGTVRRQPMHPLWVLFCSLLSASLASPFLSVVLVLAVIEVPKPLVVPPAPRCEIGWTLHIENGVVIKKVPVVICEELNGKWITAKQ